MVAKLSINGRFYDQPAKQTAKDLGINYSTLMSRVKSNTKTYKNWGISDLSTDIEINGKKYGDIDAAILALLNIKYRIDKSKSKSK